MRKPTSLGARLVTFGVTGWLGLATGTKLEARPQKLPVPTVAEQYLLSAANQDRVRHGLSRLEYDPVLAQAASYHAMQMAEHSGISHKFDGEPDLVERGAGAGARFSEISENVAEAPDSVTIHEMWMESPGHRANLLDPRVNAVGIAVVEAEGQLYAVEDFASTVASLSYSEQEAKVADLLSGTGIRAGSNEAARRTCRMDSGYAGDHRPRLIMRYTASRLDKLPEELAAKISSGKYHQAIVGACSTGETGEFSAYSIAVLLYP